MDQLKKHSVETDPRVGCLVTKKRGRKTTFHGTVKIPLEFYKDPFCPISPVSFASQGPSTPLSPQGTSAGTSGRTSPVDGVNSRSRSPAEDTPISKHFQHLSDASPTDLHHSDSVSVLKPFLITPPSIYGKRTLYTIVEFEPLCDSSNMAMSDWAKIAMYIEANYRQFDAFIVLHGTDTMTYSTSALSFMLENLVRYFCLCIDIFSFFRPMTASYMRLIAYIVFFYNREKLSFSLARKYPLLK
jgi:hypothetical protein